MAAALLRGSGWPHCREGSGRLLRHRDRTDSGGKISPASLTRIVRQIAPRWCFFENIPGHLSLGFDHVAFDLQGMGYRVAACVLSAAEVGAPHIRKRLLVLAHADLQERGESGRRVARELTALTERRGKPGMAVSGNGTELTPNAILKRRAEHKIEWPCIAPGKPMRDTALSKASAAGCGTSF